MIYKVLKILRDKLDGELNIPDPNSNNQETVDVVIDNISKEDNDSTAISNKIVITLLSVEEETTLKNTPRYERLENPKRYLKKNPPAYLNLYVMIAANRDNYQNSLQNISKVIETLQTEKVLFNENEEYKFKIQLHTLPFDQLSYAWGLLGGKILPSALYKLSIIKIQNETILTNPVKIDEINIKESKLIKIKN